MRVLFCVALIALWIPGGDAQDNTNAPVNATDSASSDEGDEKKAMIVVVAVVVATIGLLIAFYFNRNACNNNANAPPPTPVADPRKQHLTQNNSPRQGRIDRSLMNDPPSPSPQHLQPRQARSYEPPDQKIEILHAEEEEEEEQYSPSMISPNHLMSPLGYGGVKIERYQRSNSGFSDSPMSSRGGSFGAASKRSSGRGSPLDKDHVALLDSRIYRLPKGGGSGSARSMEGLVGTFRGKDAVEEEGTNFV